MSDHAVFNPGSRAPEEPIFELASDCDDLIQSCLELTSRGDDGHIKDLVDSYERRFAAWWEYLGVFAETKANLDSRLRHHTHVRDLVLRLLIVLRRNLRFREFILLCLVQTSEGYIFGRRQVLMLRQCSSGSLLANTNELNTVSRLDALNLAQTSR